MTRMSISHNFIKNVFKGWNPPPATLQTKNQLTNVENEIEKLSTLTLYNV